MRGGYIMVDFTNIRYDKDWISAEAYDCVNDARGHVRINRHTEEFWTDCTKINFFKRAMVHVLIDVDKGRLKQGSKRTVFWG